MDKMHRVYSTATTKSCLHAHSSLSSNNHYNNPAKQPAECNAADVRVSASDFKIGYIL